jgi:hypothetical protein
MPKQFHKCVRSGGRVRTVNPCGKKCHTYVKVCYPRGGGKAVRGHVHHRKK